jgi:hypothetical protein
MKLLFSLLDIEAAKSFGGRPNVPFLILFLNIWELELGSTHDSKSLSCPNK